MGPLSQKAFYTSPGAIRAAVIFNLAFFLLLVNNFDIDFKKSINRAFLNVKCFRKKYKSRSSALRLSVLGAAMLFEEN